MTVDKELLLKSRLPEADVDIPGVGTVRVRGLSRSEVLHLQMDQRGKTPDPLRVERKLLAIGIVDPVLTEDEIAQWQEVSPTDELEPVTTKVQELSGLGENSDKDTYKEFDADSATEFRILPGDETGDDSGPAAGGNVER